MKLNPAALIALSSLTSFLNLAADHPPDLGHTNLVGMVSELRAETGEKKMTIPILTLNRPPLVDGSTGRRRDRGYVTLSMQSAPGMPKRPIIGDIGGNPFARWTGKKVRVEGVLAPSKPGAASLLYVTNIEEDKR